MLIVHLMRECSSANQRNAWYIAGPRSALVQCDHCVDIVIIIVLKMLQSLPCPKVQTGEIIKGVQSSFAFQMPHCFSILWHSNEECDFGSRWQPIELWPLLLFMMYVSGKMTKSGNSLRDSFPFSFFLDFISSPHHPIKGKANWPQASFLLSSAQKSITAQQEILWLFSQWTRFHLDSFCWSW